MGSRFYYRWVPSEWNAADYPSRFYESVFDKDDKGMKHEFKYSSDPILFGSHLGASFDTVCDPQVSGDGAAAEEALGGDDYWHSCVPKSR